METMIVMAIMLFIGGLGLYYNLSNLNHSSFSSDHNILISSLLYSRGKAIANICNGLCIGGMSHGVYLNNNKYIIFQGENYSTRNPLYDITFEANPNIISSGINEIVFEKLSGEAKSVEPPPWNIYLKNTQTNQKSTITINSEGQILWTN